MNPRSPIRKIQRVCDRLETALSGHLLTVCIREQALILWEINPAEAVGRLALRGVTGRSATGATVGDCGYTVVEKFRCSTSKFGIGQVKGSNCTPLGLHRIVQRIGDGAAVGTVFKSRKPVGLAGQGVPSSWITTRILWLEGLEPGFNCGGDVDTFKRYIYIHGTGDELTIGKPASHGCIHLAAADLVSLYDKLPVGTLVWIEQ